MDRSDTAALVEDEKLYDIDFVCGFFGGSKPLHIATIYRGMNEGRYPRPVRPSPNVNRWVGRELKAAMQAIIEAPRQPLRSPRINNT
jgi:predicted DNA-binding transcriptional regulator AlpA